MPYNLKDPSGRDLASTVLMGALKGYLISDQRRYEQQTMAQEQANRMQSTQQVGDIQMRNQAALEGARTTSDMAAADAKHKDALREERKKRIYELLFGGDELKKKEDEAYASSKGRLRAEAQYGKPAKGDEPPDFEDYMSKVKTDYGDATPEWQRKVADTWLRTGDRQAAIVLAGPMATKKEPKSEGDILAEKTKILKSWDDADVQPGGDPATNDRLAETMARKDIDQNEAMKVLSAEDAAAAAEKHFGIMQNTKTFDPAIIDRVLGRESGLDGPQSLRDLAGMGLDKKLLIGLIQKYMSVAVGMNYQKATNGDVSGNGR